MEFVFLQDVDEALRAALEPRREAKDVAVKSPRRRRTAD
jgi:hypothetical protein